MEPRAFHIPHVMTSLEAAVFFGFCCALVVLFAGHYLHERLKHEAEADAKRAMQDWHEYHPGETVPSQIRHEWEQARQPFPAGEWDDEALHAKADDSAL